MKYDDEDWFNNGRKYKGTILLWKIVLVIFVIFFIVALIEKYC